MMVSSGQRADALVTALAHPFARGRFGLGRSVIENTSSSPNGAATLIVSSASSRTPTANAGATKPASACAAGLAKGLPLEAAVAEAWAYVAEAIRRAPGLGRGHGPLDHGWPLRESR